MAAYLSEAETLRRLALLTRCSGFMVGSREILSKAREPEPIILTTQDYFSQIEANLKGFKVGAALNQIREAKASLNEDDYAVLYYNVASRLIDEANVDHFTAFVNGVPYPERLLPDPIVVLIVDLRARDPTASDALFRTFTSLPAVRNKLRKEVEAQLDVGPTQPATVSSADLTNQLVGFAINNIDEVGGYLSYLAGNYPDHFTEIVNQAIANILLSGDSSIIYSILPILNVLQSEERFSGGGQAFAYTYINPTVRLINDIMNQIPMGPLRGEYGKLNGILYGGPPR